MGTGVLPTSREAVHRTRELRLETEFQWTPFRGVSSGRLQPSFVSSSPSLPFETHPADQAASDPTSYSHILFSWPQFHQP